MKQPADSIEYPNVYIGAYLVSIVAVMAAVSQETPPAFFIFHIIFWPLLFGSGFLCGWRYGREKHKVAENLSNILAVIAVLFFTVIFLIEGFERAFVFMLIWLLAARTVTLSARRELYFIYIISLVFMLYAASLSRETSFVIYIVLYVLAGTFALMVDHMDERLSKAMGGDKDFLLNNINLPVKGTGVAAIIISFGAVLYLFVPRPPSLNIKAFPTNGKWMYNDSWKADAKKTVGAPDMDRDLVEGTRLDFLTSETGTADYQFSDTLDTVRVPGRCLSNELLFYVRSDRPLYVRGKIFDTFDGRFWKISDAKRKKLYSGAGKFIFDSKKPYRGTAQTYIFAKDMQDTVLSAYRPVMLVFPGEVIETGPDLTLRAPAVLRKDTTYSVLSEVMERNGRPSGGREIIKPGSRYLAVPSTLSDRLKEFAFSVTKKTGSDFEKAVSVEEYLKTNYGYTIASAFKEKSQKPIEEFLFEGKAGHCELFASSMVLLLRSLAIPSRLATGYNAGQFNPITGYYEVREMHAHAWVEAYISNEWITFEPTPGHNIYSIPRGYFAAASVARYVEDYVNSMIRLNPDKWQFSAIATFMDYSRKITLSAKGLLKKIKKAFVAAMSLLTRNVYGIASALAVLACLSALGYFRLFPLFRKLRLKRLMGSDPLKFALACYYEMERLFARKGMRRPASLTVTEYRDMLTAKSGHLSGQINVITGLFQKKKYSQSPVTTEDVKEAYRAYEHIEQVL